MTSAPRGPSAFTSSPPAAIAVSSAVLRTALRRQKARPRSRSGTARGEQRAEQDVLDAVAESAQQVARERDGQDRPGRLDAHPGALDRDCDESTGGGQGWRHAARQSGGAADHPAIQTQTSSA
jgi:hypothetical protein